MPTATAPRAPSFDVEPIDLYRTPGDLAGTVAWEVLTHDPVYLGDFGRLRDVELAGLEHEDAWQFLFDVVTEAGRLGYLMAKIDLAAFHLPTYPADYGKVTTERVVRAIAALVGTTLAEDGLNPWPKGSTLHEKAGGAAS